VPVVADLARFADAPQQVAEAIGDAVATAGAPDNHTAVVVDLT